MKKTVKRNVAVLLLPLVLFIASLPAEFEIAKSSNAYRLDIGNTKTPDAFAK